MEHLSFSGLMTQAISMSPVSDEEYERLLNRRAPVEPREGVECSKCGNHEFTWVLRDGQRFCHTCECKAERDSLARIRKSGLSEQMERCTFASFQTPEAWQKTAKELVLRFVQDAGRGWLLVCGQSGSGKTHLCTAAAGRFIRAGADMRYMRWVDESTTLKAVVNDDEEYLRRISPLKNCAVLYIDDFFKTRSGDIPSNADIRLAMELLDHRYCNRKKVTIISTERSMDELLAIDEATGGRIYERTRGYRVEMQRGKGKNWRITHD